MERTEHIWDACKTNVQSAMPKSLHPPRSNASALAILQILAEVQVCAEFRVFDACTGGTVGVVLMKFGMYLMCRNSKDSSVQAFALDHINDVLINSVGLLGVPIWPLLCICAWVHVVQS